MASRIISRPMPDSFSTHLREAIEALGYYRIDALDQLLVLYQEQWPRGLSSTMFRISDIRHMMSEKGLADPYHAQKATHLRANFNLRREEFDAELPESATGLIFWARAKWLCEEAGQRNQTEIPVSDKWQLPLPGCGQEWCPCHWTATFDLT